MTTVVAMSSPTWTFLQNKGGVGKTTIALTIAATAASTGQRVLIIDADQQTNATWLLDPAGQSDGDFTIYDITAGNAPRGCAYDIAVPTAWNALPSISNSGGAVDLIAGDTQFNEAHLLRSDILALARSLDGPCPYDLMIIDCPPSTGMVVQAALAASHAGVVVTQAQHLSVKGVEQSLTFIEEFNAAAATGGWTPVTVAGIIVNQMVATQTEQQAALEELTSGFAGLVLDPPMPHRAVLQQAIGAHYPITELTDAQARAITRCAQAYLDHLSGSTEVSDTNSRPRGAEVTYA